jgi:hypothetical protein
MLCFYIKMLSIYLTIIDVATGMFFTVFELLLAQITICCKKITIFIKNRTIYLWS